MLDRILVPLDGSDLAESVLVQARRMLARRDAELLLLRVVTLPPTTEEDAGQPLDQIWAHATEYLQRLSLRLEAEGLHVRGKVVEGFPAPGILDVASREGASLIVMSTHGRSGISRWVFGSVTEKVLRASPIPVLAVPSFVGAGGDAFPRGPKELSFKTIVCPIAGQDLSLEVLPALSAFARRFESKVILVNVREEVESAVPVGQLEAARDQLLNGGIAAEPLLLVGDPALRILAAADEKGADLIAMTTHGRRGLSRWLLGSVAEKVLRGANVPILVVRPPGKSPPAASAERSTPVEFHTDP